MSTLSGIAEQSHQAVAFSAPSAARDLMWRRIHVVVGATLAMALGFGTLALTSVFIRPLEAEFAWTRAEVSFGYAAGTIGMALGGYVWGRVTDRVDVRILMAIGGSGMVLSVLSMTAVHTLWQFYLANLVLGGLGFAVLYTPLLAATKEWFDRRRGVAIGIVTAGGALGQGVVPFLANVLIDSLGWRLTFLTLAIATILALGFTLPRITRPVDADSARQRSSHHDAGASPAERLRVAGLSLAAFLCCACMGVPLVHMASFVGSVCGSPAIGATSLLVAMLSGTIGRVCFGFIADRIGYLPSYALASAIQTACVVAYPLLGDSMSLIALSAVFGFGFAGNMTCLILCVGEAVPAHRFGSALGLTMLVAWVGMGVGGYAGGVLFDIYLNYTFAFALAGLMGVLNLLTIARMAWTARLAHRTVSSRNGRALLTPAC
jgi:MFS family permease